MTGRPWAALVMVLTLSARPTGATPPPRARPASLLIGPLTTTPGAVVQLTDLSLTCVDAGGARRCDARIGAMVSAPTAGPVTVVIGGTACDRAAVLAGGQELPVTILPPAELGRLVRTLLRVAEPQGLPSKGEPLEQYAGLAPHGFSATIPVEAGKPRALVIATSLILPERTPDWQGWTLEPIRTRHLLLGTRLPAAEHRTFALEWVTRDPTTVATGPLALTVRPPSTRHRVTVTRASWPAEPAESRPMAEALQPDEQQSGDVRALTLPDPAPVLLLGMDTPTIPVAHGGPVLGFGGELRDGTGFMGRFGYEMAAPRWLIESLTLDTDFRHRLVLALGLEAASPGILGLIPSLSIGVGLPIELLPQRDVGVRVSLGAHWPVVGVAVSFDIFPRRRGEPDLLHIGVYATLSL